MHVNVSLKQIAKVISAKIAKTGQQERPRYSAPMTVTLPL